MDEVAHWCVQHGVEPDAVPLIAEDFDRELDEYVDDLKEYGL